MSKHKLVIDELEVLSFDASDPVPDPEVNEVSEASCGGGYCSLAGLCRSFFVCTVDP
jgi:hypothetical protein